MKPLSIKKSYLLATLLLGLVASKAAMAQEQQTPSPPSPSGTDGASQASPPPSAAPPPAAPTQTGSGQNAGNDTNKESTKRRGFRLPPLGVDADAYFFSSAKARNRFGASLTGFGLGIRSIVPPRKARFEPDIKFLSNHHDANGFSNRFFMADVGVGYRTRIGGTGERAHDGLFIPYAGVTTDLQYVNLRSEYDGVKKNGLIGVGGSVFLGTAIGKTGFVEARYRAASSTNAFNLSGTSLNLGIRF